MISTNRIYLLCVLTIALLSACKDKTETPKNDFDRKSLLTNFAENIITPNFKDLQSKVNILSSKSDDFFTTTNEKNLSDLRDAWKNAFISFQHCAPYAFGPADLTLGTFTEVLGTYPVDVEGVEKNLKDTQFQLSSSFKKDIRGFLTLEYFIFGLDADIITGFNNDSQRKAYYNAVLAEIKKSINSIVSQWEGDYKNTFINNTAISAGSPISALFNTFVKNFENIKNYKLEIPAGLQAGQPSTAPQKVEAYYSGISSQLIKESFLATENVWLGKSKQGKDGIGFEEYLMAVEGGADLVTKTKAKIKEIKVAIDKIQSKKLSDIVGSEEVKNVHDLMQSNTANFKSSMQSLLGISITFNDGDGD